MNTDSKKCATCKLVVHMADTSGSIKTFPNCDHVYHADCLEEPETCPTCRAVNIGKKVAMYAGGAIVGASLAPVVAPAAVGLLGFGAAGPVAGSIAAAIQSTIGNVAAGSLFAMAQSVGMGGALPAMGYAAGAAIGAAGAAVAGDATPENEEDGDNAS